MIKKDPTTLFFSKGAFITSAASVAGTEEANGPLKDDFSLLMPDGLWGENSFEQAERKMFEEAVRYAVGNENADLASVNCLIGGDLLNQIVTAGYAARDLDIPYLGVYGACSSMAEALLLASTLINAGHMDKIVCATSSHFGSAERQYRNPLELGSPPAPSCQNTVTAAAAILLSSQKDKNAPRITSATVGSVCDFGITDANNMGGAMAPAALQTILRHLENTNTQPEDYDLILTGDLGEYGSQILRDLAKNTFRTPLVNHQDAGVLIYEGLNKSCGGSGCGCGAAVLSAKFIPALERGDLRRVLFVATGALHSPVALQQKENIPGIAHAISIERA